METEKCCDNCACEYLCDKHTYMLEKVLCYEYDCFAPKEQLVRKSEREKTIQDIKNEFWINDGDNDFISIKDLNLALDKYLKLKEK